MTEIAVAVIDRPLAPQESIQALLWNNRLNRLEKGNPTSSRAARLGFAMGNRGFLGVDAIALVEECLLRTQLLTALKLRFPSEPLG